METGLAKPRVTRSCAAPIGLGQAVASHPWTEKPPAEPATLAQASGSLCRPARTELEHTRTPLTAADGAGTHPLLWRHLSGEGTGSWPWHAGETALARAQELGSRAAGAPQPPLRPLDHQGGEQRARSGRHGVLSGVHDT